MTLKITITKGQVKPNNKSSPGPIGNTQGIIVPKTSPNASGGGNSAPPIKPQPKEEGWWKSWGSDVTHGILDVAGLIPVVGEFADAASVVVYTAEGDYANAAISAAVLVPVAGEAILAAKIARQPEKQAIKEAKKLAVVIRPLPKGQVKANNQSSPGSIGNTQGIIVPSTSYATTERQILHNTSK